MEANRYLTLAALVLAYALFAFALAPATAPMLLALLAGLVALSHKDLSYTYAWVADSYAGLQPSPSGSRLLPLSLVGVGPATRIWLWASMAPGS
jgi:hypothetical protein